MSTDSSFLQDISNTDWSIYMKFDRCHWLKSIYSVHIHVYSWKFCFFQ
jgi:hypothetical protein